jgi:hypothetical protein
MVWPKNPTTVEELPVTGINGYKFSMLSREAEQALCTLVAARCSELEQATQGDSAKERWLANLLVDTAVAVQQAIPQPDESWMIA